jgi:ketosteroid isomerase-like protein
MSEETVEIVRQPVVVRPASRRRPDEWLLGAFSPVLGLLARVVARLPPRSRFRQAMLRRVVEIGFEATNRGDYRLPFSVYHRDCECSFPPQLATLGVDPEVRGREARIRFQERWSDDWGEFRLQPNEVIDLGNRLLLIGRIRGTGSSSGASIDNDWAVLFEIAGGQMVREQIFLDHAKALEAAGLSE